MSAEIQFIVGLIEIADGGDQFRFIISFKAGARRDVENAVGTVPEVRVVTAALDFQRIDVVGIELWTEIAGNVGVRNRHAVDQPTDLMPPAHVQLVVREIGSRHIVGDHRQAVGSRGAGCFRDFLAIHERRGRYRFALYRTGVCSHRHRLILLGQMQLKVQYRRAAGQHGNLLHLRHKAGVRYRHLIFAEWHGVEMKIAVNVALRGDREIGVLPLQHCLNARHGPVLRIVHHAAHRPEHHRHRGACDCEKIKK